MPITRRGFKFIHVIINDHAYERLVTIVAPMELTLGLYPPTQMCKNLWASALIFDPPLDNFTWIRTVYPMFSEQSHVDVGQLVLVVA